LHHEALKREVPLLFSSFLLQSSSSQGDSEQCLLAFSYGAEGFLIRAGVCVCARVCAHGTSVESISVGFRLLGQEPWEAGGLNNEEPEPSDLAGPPQLCLSFIR